AHSTRGAPRPPGTPPAPPARRWFPVNSLPSVPHQNPALRASIARAVPLKTKPALAGAVRQRRNASVVFVSRAVEDHALDADSLGARGNEPAYLLGLDRLVARCRTQRRLHC